MAFSLEIYFTHPLTIQSTTINLSNYVTYYSPTTGIDRVTEQVGLRLPTGLTAARAFLRSLEDAFRRARESDRSNTPPRVFVAFTPDDAENEYVAQLYDGYYQAGETILTRAQNTAEIYEYTLTWTREANWNSTSSEAAVSSVTSYRGIGYNSVSTKWAIYNSGYTTAITNEILAAGNGVLTSFSGTTATANIQRSRSTPTFKYTIAAANYTYTYDQLKQLAAGTTKVTSVTLNFVTGAWTLDFSTAPDNATNITLTYNTGYGNYLQIDGQSGSGLSLLSYSLSGEQPSDIILSLTNEDATAEVDGLWVGCYLAPAPDQYPQLWYEVEDADYSVAVEVVGSLQGDAQCSNGEQVAWTITTTEQIIADLTIDTQDILRMAGKWYAPILRYGDTNQGNIPYILIRWQVYTDDGAGARAAKIFETDQFLPGADNKILHQLGILQLPPQNLFTYSVLDSTFSTPGDIHIVITAQAVDTSRALSLDALMLMPTDFFSKVVYAGAIPEDEQLQISGRDATAAHVTAAGDDIRTLQILHAMPTLDPTRDQRWYMLWTDDAADTTKFDWQMTVSLSHYPKRGSI